MQSYEFLSIFSRYNFVNLHSNLKITQNNDPQNRFNRRQARFV